MQYLMLVVLMLLVGCGSVEDTRATVEDNPKEFLPEGYRCHGEEWECLGALYNEPDQECEADSVVMNDDQCAIGVCLFVSDSFCSVRCGEGIFDCFGFPDECVEVVPGKSFCVPPEYISGD